MYGAVLQYEEWREIDWLHCCNISFELKESARTPNSDQKIKDLSRNDSFAATEFSRLRAMTGLVLESCLLDRKELDPR